MNTLDAYDRQTLVDCVRERRWHQQQARALSSYALAEKFDVPLYVVRKAEKSVQEGNDDD